MSPRLRDDLSVSESMYVWIKLDCMPLAMKHPEHNTTRAKISVNPFTDCIVRFTWFATLEMTTFNLLTHSYCPGQHDMIQGRDRELLWQCHLDVSTGHAVDDDGSDQLTPGVSVHRRLLTVR